MVLVEPEISLNAIVGTPYPNTMRLLGHIRCEQVVILVDSGSTHSFLDPSVARRTQLEVDELKKLTVRVANGVFLQSAGLYDFVNLRVQDNQSYPFLYVLKLMGCDVVLAVNWLETLGPITWDFSKLSMKFTKDEQLVELKELNLKHLIVKRTNKTMLNFVAKGKSLSVQIHNVELV